MRERAYRQVCGQRARRRNVTVSLAISPTNGLVFPGAFLGGTTRRFNDFLARPLMSRCHGILFLFFVLLSCIVCFVSVNYLALMYCCIES